MSPFEALTKDPRKKNHSGGTLCPPPCRIGLIFKTKVTFAFGHHCFRMMELMFNKSFTSENFWAMTKELIQNHMIDSFWDDC